MKRFISLIIVLLLCVQVYSISGFAETSFDVSNYTDNELIDIMLAIYEADTNLGYLYYGDEFEVGKDIPAGHYEFWIEEGDVGGGEGILFRIQCSAEHKNLEYYENIKDNELGVHKQMTLEEGQFLWLTIWNGTDVKGVRIKYVPNRKSGLFTN